MNDAEKKPIKTHYLQMMILLIPMFGGCTWQQKGVFSYDRVFATI